MLRHIMSVLAFSILTSSFAADNIALNQPYSLSPNPSYGLCTDAGDATQLTDGIYSEGYFWAQPETVGWSGGGLRFITIDLQQIHAISGVLYNTAAGVAGVEFPAKILVYVSDDGAVWHFVDDVVALHEGDPLPPTGEYHQRAIFTNQLRTHGRFVKLVVDQPGSYCFVDEVEVYAGDEAWLAEALPEPALNNVEDHLRNFRVLSLVQEQLQKDLDAIRGAAVTPNISEAQQQTFMQTADIFTADIKKLTPPEASSFKAIFPLNDLHRKIYALNAEVQSALGIADFSVWKKHRWEHLEAVDFPRLAEDEPVLDVEMLNGEVRADTLNLSNTTPQALSVNVTLNGFAEAKPGWLSVYEVLHTGTRRCQSVAAALQPAQETADGWQVTVPSGMTVMLWFSFAPIELSAGLHTGQITLQTPGITASQVPLQLRISSLKPSTSLRLLIGGWDYADGTGVYAVNAENRQQYIQFLKDHNVNVPWSTSQTMPAGVYDTQGNLVEYPDTARFDEWLEAWDGAKLYMVFLAQGEKFADAEMGTAEFETRVGNWARFWADHLRAKGMSPRQLGFLVYDEPQETKGYDINRLWADAIQKVEPDFLLFVDPIPQGPADMEPMCEAMDVLCPNRVWWQQKPWHEEFFIPQRDLGRELWFYSCSGPARGFDPLSYYLSQAWHAFSVGAVSSHFWAFGDTNFADVWNEYASDGVGPYSANFIDNTGVTSSRWFEAIAESALDYEILMRLKDAMESARQAGNAPEFVENAQKLLTQDVASVLEAAGMAEVSWREWKDYSVADKVRSEAVRLLEQYEALNTGK